ncbi:MAG: hypothetical protein RQ899_10270 [Pseudomonadales bacterium]|nr:hypothetical protein [Pseudomonadales bacterium]
MKPKVYSEEKTSPFVDVFRRIFQYCGLLASLFAFLFAAPTLAVTVTCGQGSPPPGGPPPFQTTWAIVNTEAFEFEMDGALSGQNIELGADNSQLVFEPFGLFIKPAFQSLSLLNVFIGGAPNVPSGTQVKQFTQGDFSGSPSDSCTSDLVTFLETFCSSTEPFNVITFTEEVNVGNFLLIATQNGFSQAQAFSGCSASGQPSVSGSLQSQTFNQCCEATQSIESGESFGGMATFQFPTISCQIQTFTAYPGVGVFGSLSAAASASAGYTGNSAICGTPAVSPAISGSISGSLAAQIGSFLINPDVLSVSIGVSGGASASFFGPTIQSAAFSGCIGPASYSGQITFADLHSTSVSGVIENSEYCF